MRSRIRKKPTRVQLAAMSSTTMREPGTSTAAATWKAALDGSPGTWIASSSSSSWLPTDTCRPSRRTSTPPRSRSRSVWSRLGAGSTTVVRPSARMPASRSADFTCAEAIGMA